MKKIIFTLFVVCSIAVNAQRLSVTVDKNPAKVGEKIILQFSINAKASNFQPPKCEGLQILQARNNGTSSNITIINGKRTAEHSTNYSVILQAIKPGSFSISSATIEVNGKLIKSQPLRIKIVDCKNDEEKPSRLSEQIFVKAIVSKRNIYKHEQILVTYKLFKTIKIDNLEITSEPTLKGSFIEDEKVSGNYKRDLINCTAYQTVELKKTILTAKKSGEIIIDPMKLKCKYISHYEKRVGTDWFGRSIEQNVPIWEDYVFSSEPITINVKSLPESESKFMNIVGKMNIDSDINTRIVNANDAITYQINITGTGNIKEIKSLDINFPPTFEVYDPKVSEDIRRGGLINSKKSFEYTIIPRYKGSYTIPEIKLTYFNPKLKKYETKKTKSYKITVNPGSNTEQTYSNEDFNQQEAISNINDDIHYIATKTKLKKQSKPSLNIRLFYFLTFLPISILLILWLFLTTRKEKSTTEVKYQKAKETAQKRLKLAEICIEKADYNGFFEEVEKSIWGYFADKFQLPISELSKDNISKYFNKSSIEKTIEDEFISLIDECELARYTPSREGKKMEDTLEKTKKIIIQVETSVK